MLPRQAFFKSLLIDNVCWHYLPFSVLDDPLFCPSLTLSLEWTISWSVIWLVSQSDGWTAVILIVIWFISQSFGQSASWSLSKSIGHSVGQSDSSRENFSTYLGQYVLSACLSASKLVITSKHSYNFKRHKFNNYNRLSYHQLSKIFTTDSTLPTAYIKKCRRNCQALNAQKTNKARSRQHCTVNKNIDRFLWRSSVKTSVKAFSYTGLTSFMW